MASFSADATVIRASICLSAVSLTFSLLMVISLIKSRKKSPIQTRISCTSTVLQVCLLSVLCTINSVENQHALQMLQKTYVVVLIAEFCCKTIFDLHLIYCYSDKSMRLLLKLTGCTFLLLGFAFGLWSLEEPDNISIILTTLMVATCVVYFFLGVLQFRALHVSPGWRTAAAVLLRSSVACSVFLVLSVIGFCGVSWAELLPGGMIFSFVIISFTSTFFASRYTIARFWMWVSNEDELGSQWSVNSAEFTWINT